MNAVPHRLSLLRTAAVCSSLLLAGTYLYIKTFGAPAFFPSTKSATETFRVSFPPEPPATTVVANTPPVESPKRTVVMESTKRASVDVATKYSDVVYGLPPGPTASPIQSSLPQRSTLMMGSKSSAPPVSIAAEHSGSPTVRMPPGNQPQPAPARKVIMATTKSSGPAIQLSRQQLEMNRQPGLHDPPSLHTINGPPRKPVPQGMRVHVQGAPAQQQAPTYSLPRLR
jgi:hypothetical protein